MKITLTLTQDEAQALYEAVNGRHTECYDGDDPDDEAATFANLNDKIVLALRAAKVQGF